MHWFRSPVHWLDSPQTQGGKLGWQALRELLAAVMEPVHFFTAAGNVWEWVHTASEDIPWEIFQGRLLDPAHTRVRQSFESWHAYLVDGASRSAEPVLSLKLDRSQRKLYVVRAIYCHAWEGYHAGDNVYLSRETHKWVRELVGSIDLEQFKDVAELQDEIVCRLFQAVVGTSRLPLTSVEAPLPGFSLGQLAYFHQPAPAAQKSTAGPMRSYRALIGRGLHSELAWLEKTKLLESLLRSVAWPELADAARFFWSRWLDLGHGKKDLLRLLRALFNDTALSPFTDFVDKALAFVQQLAGQDYVSREDHVDFLGYLLRHIGRHLTAYDLHTFHHRGANYPDALLLDAVLRAYLGLVEQDRSWISTLPEASEAEQARQRMRRRALRQGWLLRRFYEGLPVPEVPTSPGENTRILPPPHIRVPEEQIFTPAKRTRRLFANDPLAPYLGDHGRRLLQESILDLQCPVELRELGMALFLDRPLGVLKTPGEPDQTPLLSYEAFSRSIAHQRLEYLAQELIPDQAEYDRLQRALAELPVRGLSLNFVGGTSRPEAVSLADARQAADDFVVLRTTRQAVTAFLDLFNFDGLGKRFCLDWLLSGQPTLVVRASAPAPETAGRLAVFDSQLRQRLELRINTHAGYESRGGTEYPAAGLQVLRVWEPAGADEVLREHCLAKENVVIRPKSRR